MIGSGIVVVGAGLYGWLRQVRGPDQDGKEGLSLESEQATKTKTLAADAKRDPFCFFARGVSAGESFWIDLCGFGRQVDFFSSPTREVRECMHG